MLDDKEQYHFEWFWCRTQRKLPGAFQSPQSNALLFKACIAEEAVTHALLALSSVHRNALVYTQARPHCPTPEESFTLIQYNKAIKCLQDGVQSQSIFALRISLFLASSLTLVECFRSRYRLAKLHLEYGLRLLGQLRSLLSTTEVYNGGQVVCDVDEYFFLVFKRLYVQYALLQEPQISWHCDMYMSPLSHTGRFASTDVARTYLEDSLLDLRQLELNDLLGPAVVRCTARGRSRIAIKKDLSAWKMVYDETMKAYESTLERQKWFAYKLLHLYYTMCEIMSGALRGHDECIYDTMTPLFLSMLQQLLDIRDIASRAQLREQYFGSEEGLSHSISDMGVVIPLYFLAVKCRIPRIRLQAIELVAETPRHEYVWDSTLATNIAKTIMKLEEGLAYDKVIANTRFCENTMPKLAELERPIVQSSKRLRYVSIHLPDSSLGNVTLKCKRSNTMEDFEVVL